MAEQKIKVLENANARVLIVKRADGAYTVACTRPRLSVYDSPETAESEARVRVWWLATNG